MKNTTKIYKVYDDEWSEIMGIGQLIKFAKDRLFSIDIDENEFCELPISLQTKILSLLKEQEIRLYLGDAKQILNFFNYEIEEVEIY